MVSFKFQKENEIFSTTISKESKQETRSSIESNEEKPWPYLSVISKVNTPFQNGQNRRQFPNPTFDKTILLSCQWSKSQPQKVRHVNMEKTVNNDPKVFFRRFVGDEENSDPDCSFFISVDKIESEKPSTNHSIMLCDVRDHRLATKFIPNEVTGFWIRILGPPNKFTFQISLWQSLNTNRKKNSNFLMKVNEMNIDIKNIEAPKLKSKKKKKHQTDLALTLCFPHRRFKGGANTPTFCSNASFTQIISSLHDLFEEGKLSEFSEVYEMFCRQASEGETNQNKNAELKLFLLIEKSLFHTLQGEYRSSKKIIQQVVKNIIPKSLNKSFLLNRAYSYLASIHVLEGNLGTAQDCLNVLHVDRKGTLEDDLGHFYTLQGEIVLGFSKKLPNLRIRLAEEALFWFDKAKSTFEKGSKISLHKLRRLHLLKAELLLEGYYHDPCKVKLQEVKDIFEKLEGESLSLRNRCFMMLLKCRCSLFIENYWKRSEDLLTECKRIAEETFPEFKSSIKRLEKEREGRFVHELSSTLERLEIKGLKSNDMSYQADHESS
ncbi:uncharacterized protein [Clytia hemisphaerica]|uniref:Uncharacterized protein n=1 Tax=Clytia hemisphaerica TaxID=252671 RepID=A0A7M5WLZ8_9CNID